MTPPFRHRRHQRELDPNRATETAFRRCCGAKRFVFNEYVAASKRRFLEGTDKDRFLKVNDFKRGITSRKAVGDLLWLGDVPSGVVEAAADDANQAHQNFYAARKKANAAGGRGRRVGLPRFKKRGRSRDSFRLRDRQVTLIDRRHVEMTKIGTVRLKEPFALATDSRLVSVTVYREADRWFASFLISEPDEAPTPVDGPVCGVDLGITTFATLSSEAGHHEKIASPNPLRGALRRLATAQRRCARKQKGSNNRKKATLVVAELHRRVKNVREDFVHRFTTELARTKSVIVVEDLSVANMVRNHCLALAILDQMWGGARRQFGYKTKQYGSRLLAADRWFASSKICSACEYRMEGLLLRVRVWTCPACGTRHDRDGNAAENLRLYGERLVPRMPGEVTPAEIPLRASGTAKGRACGAPEALVTHGSMKQEAGATGGLSLRTVSPVDADVPSATAGETFG
ncbi:MAG: RNA-guided endonuclease InsQ/TnpB family protein [Polyangiales bacterium]